jgi:hypothetical protein
MRSTRLFAALPALLILVVAAMPLPAWAGGAPEGWKLKENQQAVRDLKHAGELLGRWVSEKWRIWRDHSQIEESSAEAESVSQNPHPIKTCLSTFVGRFNGEVKHHCIERYGKDAIHEVCRKWNIADADCEDNFVKDVVDHILLKDPGLKCNELNKTFKEAAERLAEDAADTKCTNVFSSAENN